MSATVIFIDSKHTPLRRGWRTCYVEKSLADMGINSRLILVDSSEDLYREFCRAEPVIAWPTIYDMDATVRGSRSLHQALEFMNIPFVGPSAGACIYHDKLHFKNALRELGILTPAYRVVSQHVNDNDLGYPVMLKASRSCNSWSVIAVSHAEELLPAISTLRDKNSAEIFLEEWRRSKEYTVAYMPPSTKGGHPLVAPMELRIRRSQNLFIDKELKANDDMMEFRVPQHNVGESLCEITLSIVDGLGIDGHCRIDFVQDDTGSLYAIDLNLVPFMSWSSEARSYFPRAVEIQGGPSYSEVLRGILVHGFQRSAQERLRSLSSG